MFKSTFPGGRYIALYTACMVTFLNLDLQDLRGMFKGEPRIARSTASFILQCDIAPSLSAPELIASFSMGTDGAVWGSSHLRKLVSFRSIPVAFWRATVAVTRNVP